MFTPRRIPALALRQTRSLTTARPLLAGGATQGRREDHITNSTDTLDVQSSASKSGAEERQEDASNASASTEKDKRNDNERAQKDHPESPMVIGMNDERGGVSCSTRSSMIEVLTDLQKGH